jgi:hypothetical protein
VSCIPAYGIGASLFLIMAWNFFVKMLSKELTMLQVLTTVFNHITFGLPPFTLKAPIKVSGDYWGKNSGELEVIVKDNELVCGVIDKAQFGKYGIVHTFQELYGPGMAGRLLSIFSRLFTVFYISYGYDYSHRKAMLSILRRAFFRMHC